MDFETLLQGVAYTGTPPAGNATLVTHNSRKVRPGAVFVCVAGRTADGHQYAPAALAAGAALIVSQRPLGLAGEVTVPDTRAAYARLCQNFFGRPAERLVLVGVTGTNGKTTVSSVLKQLLERLGVRCGLIGTNRAEIAEMLVPARFTTPDPWDLSALFARMVAAGCTHVVMEASSQALDQGRLLGLRFALAVFTNLTQDHLDWHGSMRAYYLAKQRLFMQCDAALVNQDDTAGRALMAESSAKVIKSYSLENDAADFVAKNMVLRAGASRFAYLNEDTLLPVTFAMPGAYNVANALAALAAAVMLGQPAPEAARALGSVPGVAGRCEVLYGGAFTVIRDFAHTADALDKLFAALKPFVAGRLVVLFGCAGQRDAAKRPQMGTVVAKAADAVYLTSDNPRAEDEADTMAGALPPLKDSGKPLAVQPDRAQAVREALESLSDGDLLLLCGKGHEDYQVLNGYTVYLDEKALVEAWLAEKGFAGPGGAP